MKNKYYVTTPIYYASGDLTVGHCFCTVLTDACARFFRLNGDDVFFLTGSDEHGLKIARKAEEAHVTPQEFVDKTVEHFKHVWNKLGISYDKFIRTTDKEHVECVTKIAQALYDKGYIYKGTYKGLYCVPCETFYSEGQLVEGKCPECHRDVEPTNVEAYFFKMSVFQDYLKKLFKDDHFLVPESRRTEIYNNFVKPGVADLCISRNTFDWGIPLPFDSKHVIYVWIDALTNYISALGYGSKDDSLYKKFWPADVHFVGRDITRFHAMIWPAILKALDIPAPKQIHSTGFITLRGDKISKSKSNGFNPLVLIDRYGVDALRYYLIKEGPIFDDIPYASDVFLNTINADLCNTYGNLVSRTLAMITQYFGGTVPQPSEFNNDDKSLIDSVNSLKEEVTKLMKEQRVDEGIRKVFDVLGQANKYIDITTPWILARSEEGKPRLATVLYVLQESIRVATVMLQPYLVELPSKVFEQLNVDESLRTFDSAKFMNDNYGRAVTKGEAIFGRLNIAEEVKVLDTEHVKEEKVEPVITHKPDIPFSDFEKVEIRVGLVLNSEKVEKADKLLKSTIKIGNETRTIVSGIAKHYEPKDLIGKRVLVVTNLEPRTIRGIESRGMVLCALTDDEKVLKVTTVDGEIADGCEVS
ncbi:MAG: methionine--tRNA ligase [Clostridia bacterium]|nr:methionine--tRNA ligase [Clostridia bacterium]